MARDDERDARSERAPRKPDVRAQKSRAKILASARQLFLDKGYDINLEEVAAHAGMVKRTLYNHFTSKRALLDAVLDVEHAHFRANAPLYEGVDLRGLLTHYANLHRTFVLSEHGIKFYRLIVANVSQFPDMAASVYAAGVGGVIESLTRKLDEAVAAGTIKPTSTRRMAERFYSALGGMSHRRAATGLGFDPDDYVTQYADETIEMFVQALTPAPKPEE